MRGFSWTKELYDGNADDVDILKFLMANGYSIHARDSEGYTALHAAVYLNYGRCIEFLILQGVDIWAKAKPDGRTALHFACLRNGDLPTVRLLLRLGAHPNARNKLGETPMFDCLTSWQSPAIVDELVRYGADINAQNKDSCTMLDIAVIHESYMDDQYVQRGAWFSRVPKKKRPKYLYAVREQISNCWVATRAVRIVLKLRGVHKDVIPLIESLVWQSRENELLWNF